MKGIVPANALNMHEHLLDLSDEPIRFWWSEVKSQCSWNVFKECLHRLNVREESLFRNSVVHHVLLILSYR